MRRFDPFDARWDPVEEGTLELLEGIEEGIPWEAWLGWVDGGWSRVVGLSFGDAPVFLGMRGGPGSADPDTRRRNVGRLVLEEAATVDPDVAARVAAAVERHRAEVDVSQRVAMVFRDVAGGVLDGDDMPAVVGGLPFVTGAGPGGVHGDRQVGLASGLYRLFEELGRKSVTIDVAQALGVSRATAARRIAEARDRGYLPPVRPAIVRRDGR